MPLFEHPLQLFQLTYPQGWELRYQEDTGGAILVHPGIVDATAVSLTPLAITGSEAALEEQVQRVGERMGVPVTATDIQTGTWGDTRYAYAEGTRADSMSQSSRFRFWVLRHGPLALHVAQLGPGAEQVAQRHAADAILESLIFPEIMPPTPEEFRNRVLEIIATEHPELQARGAGEWAIALQDTDGSEIGALGLENLYRSCLLRSEAAGMLIREHLAQVLEALENAGEEGAPDSFEAVRERILPMLRSEDWVREASEKMDIAYVEFAPGLYLCFVLDEPTRLAYLTRDRIKGWDLPLERLQEVAQDNLAARRDNLRITQLEGRDGKPYAYVVQSMDGYDATRLTIPSLREYFHEELGDGYLVGIPNRDFLIAFSDRDPEMTAGIIRQVVQDYQRMHHPISQRVYRVTADLIQPAEL